MEIFSKFRFTSFPDPMDWAESLKNDKNHWGQLIGRQGNYPGKIIRGQLSGTIIRVVIIRENQLSGEQLSGYPQREQSKQTCTKQRPTGITATSKNRLTDTSGNRYNCCCRDHNCFLTVAQVHIIIRGTFIGRWSFWVASGLCRRVVENSKYT